MVRKKQVFIWSKNEIEAARKKGIHVGQVERRPGLSLGKLFTTSQVTGEFAPRHQAIPAEIIVISTVGSTLLYICHEIDQQGFRRGERINAVRNLGSGTPIVGDKVLLSIDADANPVFFFEDQPDDPDCDSVLADGACYVDVDNPNTSFDGQYHVLSTAGASGNTVKREGLIEFDPAIDVSDMTLLYLGVPVKRETEFNDNGDLIPDPFWIFNLDVFYLTSAFDCSTVTWNTKPTGTQVKSIPIYIQGDVTSVCDEADQATTEKAEFDSPLTLASPIDDILGDFFPLPAIATSTLHGFRFVLTGGTLSSGSGTIVNSLAFTRMLGLSDSGATVILFGTGGEFG